MSRWFRHYAGMMRDDKLVRVALRCKQPIERVVWVYGAILESAAEVDDDGRYDFDAAEAAYFLRADEADIHAIEAGLADAGRIDSGVVVKWGDRQFKSDRSKERVAAYRERKRAERGDDNDKCNGGVTLQKRHRDAPETETETDIPPIAPRKRGAGKHLLPDDWQLPSVAELTPKAKECAEQWPRGTYEREGEAFGCFWRAEKRMKSDWRLTWCNRVIDQHPKIMREKRFAPQSEPGSFLDHLRSERRAATT